MYIDEINKTAPRQATSRAPRIIGASARPRDAALLLGVSLATIWRWAAERHDFPRPHKIGPRTTVFVTAELIAFRDKQIGGVQ